MAVDKSLWATQQHDLGIALSSCVVRLSIFSSALELFARAWRRVASFFLNLVSTSALSTCLLVWNEASAYVARAAPPTLTSATRIRTVHL